MGLTLDAIRRLHDLMAHGGDVDRARAAVAAASRRLAAEGLLIGTAGNVSARVGDAVAVTCTGLVLAEATPEDVTVVSLDGTVLEGTLRPTSEVQFHLGAARLGAGATVHTHAPWATAAGLVLDELPVIHYQLLALGGAIPVVPFHVFGSPELAQAVGSALDGRKAALLAHHGAVTVGTDLADAVEASLLLEWSCRLYMQAAAVEEPRALTAAQQSAVIEEATRVGYGAKHHEARP